MSKTLWNALVLSPAVLGATIIAANSTLAADNSVRLISQDKTTAIDLPAIGSFQERPEVQALNASVPGLGVSPSSEVNPIPTNPTQVAQVPETANEPTSNSTLDRINEYNEDVNSSPETESLDQVTSVSQLRDVQPTDWAFQALQSLVERYGCIEGYPDRTYRGNRAMTRYEFAAGLNKCLDRIQELIAALPAGVSKEDLARLQRLQEEFAAELATLRGRVDALEARVNTVESQQFSTTTKLNGEVIFALASVFGDDVAVPSRRPQSGRDVLDNPIFGYRARLNFDTSFSGKDLLRVRLQARNINSFSGNVTGTNMTRLSFEGNSENAVEIDDLYYRFPLGNIGRAFIIANSGEFNDFTNNLRPFFEPSGTGAISRFGRFNPIYRPNDGGVGAAVSLDFGAIALELAYLALGTNTPSDKNGLFDGSYSALGQVVFFPKGNFNLGLTYSRYYSPAFNPDNGNPRVNVTGNTGSGFAIRPFGNVATSANSYGAELNWRVAKGFLISGWFGYTEAEAEATSLRGANADIINYAVSVGFPDLGAKGNFLGLVGGVPPKVIENDINANEDRDTSYHLEAFYRIQVTNNISITPGAFVILNPEHNDANDTIWVGTLRTTFRF